jgi:recombination protein RecA
VGVAQSLIEKSGSWFSFKGERIGQGRENARVYLKTHADVQQSLDAELRKRLELPAPNGHDKAPASFALA